MASTGVDRVEGLDPAVAFKAPCKVATTGNITLSGAQTIDGVAITTERVLVWNQTTQSENGIWNASGTAWTRAEDFDGNRDVVEGTFIAIKDGTTYNGSTFKVTASDPITIGTTSITFALANPLNSTIIVGTAGLDTYAKLLALDPGDYSAGDVVKVTGDGIAGDHVVVGSALASPDGGTTQSNATWFSAGKHWRRVDLENGIMRAVWFGFVADYTTTNTDNTAAWQAAIDATPIGGELVLPDGDAGFASTVNVNKTIFMLGTGATTKQQSDSATSFSGTRLFYSGVNRAILITCVSTVSLNGIEFADFELRPTVDGVNVNGIEFDPDVYSIFSCKFRNIKMYRWGSAAYATPAVGDVWDIVWDGGSIVTDEGSSRHGIDFSGTGIKYGTIIDTYIQSRAPTMYGVYMSAGLHVTNGIMELSGVGGGSGYNVGSGSVITGAHIEGFLQSGTIGMYSRGTNIFFAPGTCQSCDYGMQIESTNTEVFGHFAANVTKDILVVNGGSRAGVILHSKDYTVQDNRRDVDGINEVVELGSDTWRLNRNLHLVEGVSSTAVQSKNLAGTVSVVTTSFTGAVTFATAELDANYKLSVVASDSSGGTPAASSTVIRSIAKTTTGFTITVEAQPGAGVTVVFDWLLLR